MTWGGGIVLLALLGFAGCELRSSTERLQASLPGEFASTDSAAAELAIDLTTRGGFPTKPRDIASVDEVGFTCACRNLAGAPRELELWLATASLGAAPSPSVVRTHATRVLHGFTVPADSEMVLAYDRSIELERDADLIRAAAQTGRFSLYALSTSAPFSFILSRLTAVVVLTRKG